jgi:hypothetical protein
MAIVALLQFPHFSIILIGIAFLTISMLLIIIHKPKKWFLLHAIFASIGIILLIIGIATLSVLILTIPHGIMGLLAIISLVIEVIAGLIARNLKIKKLRKAHIWTSRFIYVFTIITLIFGILSFI